MYYRLIKPIWGQRFLGKELNTKFVKEIQGPNILEGTFDIQYVTKKNKEGYNVYWFPNHPHTPPYNKEKRYLNGKDITVFNYLFVDMDLKDRIYPNKLAFIQKLKEFPLQPTMVVNSGNGVHAYWRISDLTRNMYVILQMALLKYFRTDESVWTVLQLIRLYGTFNTKNVNDYKKVELLAEISSNKTYSIKELPHHLFKINDKMRKKAKQHVDKLDGKLHIELNNDFNIEELPESFIDLIYKNKKIRDLFEDPYKFNGDRSSADMSLCNKLFRLGIQRNDAIAVMSNTQKALEKGTARLDYAMCTIEKVYTGDPVKIKLQNQRTARFKNSLIREGELLKMTPNNPKVLGPAFFDVLHEGWRKQQALGLLGASGIGKTTVALTIFKHMIDNNPDSDDIFIFYSCEMSESEILKRWITLTDKNPKYLERLYIVPPKDYDGNELNITPQDIVWIGQEIKESSGKDIAAIVIDHMGILQNVIDTEQEPSFGAAGETEGGRSAIRAVPQKFVYKTAKPIATILDTFVIALTQTGKANGFGDVPLGKGNAYGSATYDWTMDYVMGIWQPLARVEHETNLKVLAWQYGKIREKNSEDKMTTNDYRLLTFDLSTGDLRPMTNIEKTEFDELKTKADDLRKSAEKKEGYQYKNSVSAERIKNIEESKHRLKEWANKKRD